jgi:hypothetical protein
MGMMMFKPKATVENIVTDRLMNSLLPLLKIISSALLRSYERRFAQNITRSLLYSDNQHEIVAQWQKSIVKICSIAQKHRKVRQISTIETILEFMTTKVKGYEPSMKVT